MREAVIVCGSGARAVERKVRRCCLLWFVGRMYGLAKKASRHWGVCERVIEWMRAARGRKVFMAAKFRGRDVATSGNSVEEEI